MTETAQGRQTIGDMIESQHPTFAAIFTVGIVVGGVLLLVPTVAALFAKPSPRMFRVLVAGAVLLVLDCVAVMAVGLALVEPWIGIGTLALIAVGVAVGLTARHNQKKELAK